MEMVGNGNGGWKGGEVRCMTENENENLTPGEEERAACSSSSSSSRKAKGGTPQEYDMGGNNTVETKTMIRSRRSDSINFSRWRLSRWKDWKSSEISLLNTEEDMDDLEITVDED
ncbi:hypothetical protein R1flu_006608 [Riccia fluitans]|uniref:Uncharacterized protein n=1 Tax=Riccia fluitans TaxID=41844 RepID=A0ABD1YXK4_9MARC